MRIKRGNFLDWMNFNIDTMGDVLEYMERSLSDKVYSLKATIELIEKSL